MLKMTQQQTAEAIERYILIYTVAEDVLSLDAVLVHL